MKTEEINLILHFLAKFITLSSFITLIGILVGLAFLAPENKGYFQPSRLQKFLAPVSLAWLLSSIFFLMSEVAFILNTPISEVIDGSSGKRCVSYCPGQTRGRTRFSIAP